MTPEQRIDALKLVVAEEGTNMRFETSTAQRLMTAFVTVELALGAWVVNSGPYDLRASWTIFLLNVVFGLSVATLVVLNYWRRDEVVGPLRRALSALELADAGTYLPKEPIYEWKRNTSWRLAYLLLITFFCVAQLVPLFYIR